MTMYAVSNDEMMMQGLGFGFLDFLPDPLGLFKKKEADKPKEAPAQPAFTFCPPGMVPNPQWAAIPAEGRAQAAAAGIQACLPGTSAAPTAPVKKAKCYFAAGGAKFPCTSSGFQDAIDEARQRARTGGSPRLVLHVNGKAVSLLACVQPDGSAAVGTTAASGTAAPPPAPPPAAPIPATQGPGGVFTCPTGYEIARNAAGQVVCAPPAASNSGVVPPKAGAKTTTKRATGKTASVKTRRGSVTAAKKRSGLRDPFDVLGLGAATVSTLGEYGDFSSMEAYRERLARAIAPYAGQHPNLSLRRITGLNPPPYVGAQLPPPQGMTSNQAVMLRGAGLGYDPSDWWSR